MHSLQSSPRDINENTSFTRRLSMLAEQISYYEVPDAFENAHDDTSSVGDPEVNNDIVNYVVQFDENTQTMTKKEVSIHEDISIPFHENSIKFDDVPTPTQPAVQPSINQLPVLEMWTIILGGSALSFNSGLLNGITLQSHSIPVTHITGTTSNSAISLMSQNDDKFQLMSLLIVCFLIGAAITGSLSPSNSFKLGGQYGPLFIIGSLFLGIALIFHAYAPENKAFLYFTAMSSGLQNSITTKYSSSVIRTTHVTGSMTDIGLVLGRLMRGDTKEIWKLKVLVPIYLGFWTGGIASVPCFRKYGAYGIGFNLMMFFTIGLIYSLVIVMKTSMPLWRAMLGLYKLKKPTRNKFKDMTSKISMKLAGLKRTVDHTINPLHDKRGEFTSSATYTSPSSSYAQ